jgi:hypothetical protein
VLEERVALAVTIQFDTSLDTSGFFAQNPAALTVLQEAGQTLGSALNDDLAAIVPGGNNSWTETFIDPSDPTQTKQVNDPTVAAGTVVVYVGGSVLSGPELGEGGKGGYSATGSAAWLNLVAARGQAGALASPPTDFGPWGGAIAFDTTANWSFAGPGSPPASDQYDFYSVALHELSHVLGYGTAPSWTAYANGTTQTFSGPHAEAVYGGPVPIDPTLAHWADGTLSDGSLTVMNPSLGAGQQRQYTPLDWAGLADIGWSVDRLVVTTPPPGTVASGSGFGLTVAAEDPDGTINTTYSGPITLALGDNPGGTTLDGTTTVTATGGVATFTGLTLNVGQSGSGYTLQATSGDLSAATAGPIAVLSDATAATQLVVTTEPPPSLSAGSTFGLVVTAEDASGNVDPNFQGIVTLALAGAPGGALLGGTLTATAAGGVATFSGLSQDLAARGETLQATSGTLTPAVTTPFAVTAAAATQLGVTAEPPASVTAGTGFGLVVAAEDPFGNIDPTFSGTVALALTGNTAGNTLGGTLSAPATGGTAVFAGLTLGLVAAGDTVTASSGGLRPATTRAVAVVAASTGPTQDPGGASGTVQATSTGPPSETAPSVSSLPAPTTVVGVSLQPQVTTGGKHKPLTVIVVQFSAALNPTAATNLAAYALGTVAQGRKHPSKPVPLAQASYDPVAHTVTLIPLKKLAFKPPLQLRLRGALLTDTLGTLLDGNQNGQAGSDFVATLTAGGASVGGGA